MTELIIDGVRAVLSSDFAVTVKQENPFITKNGEYTYDCTMSLLNPVNANLYSFLQRINKKDAFATNRRVILIADNRVYCDGTEVITKWTDTKVTIQIVSGNSQFNYFIGSDKKISELDLGSATVDDAAISQSIYDFESMDYVFPPFKIGDTLYNHYKLGPENDGKIYVGKIKDDATVYRAIPFINTMIEKVIIGLGYSIGINTLRSSIYRYLVLFHNQDTNEYAKMFPGWTCKEFLEGIEKMFNIVFYINYKTKVVDIMTQTKFYSTAGMIHVRDVKDAYETDVNSDTDYTQYLTANIGYNMSDTLYYRLRRIPKAVANMAIIKTMNIAELNYYISQNNIFSMILDTDPVSNKQYIVYTPEGSTDKKIEEVNQFKDIIHDETKEDLDIEIDIIPANLSQTLFDWKDPSINIDIESAFSFSTPVLDAPTSTTSDSEESSNSIYSILESGDYDKNSDSKYTMQAAIYNGPILYPYITLQNKQIAYPQVVTTNPEKQNDFLKKDNTTYNLNVDMSLDKISKEFYNSTYDINFKSKLTIESYDTNIYDPRLIFEIKNKRYICESIEYTLDSKGRKGTWKGIFYPVDISDTDAEHLWILADGRWRDNGVWLDNGRWLDN